MGPAVTITIDGHKATLAHCEAECGEPGACNNEGECSKCKATWIPDKAVERFVVEATKLVSSKGLGNAWSAPEVKAAESGPGVSDQSQPISIAMSNQSHSASSPGGPQDSNQSPSSSASGGPQDSNQSPSVSSPQLPPTLKAQHSTAPSDSQTDINRPVAPMKRVPPKPKFDGGECENECGRRYRHKVS